MEDHTESTVDMERYLQKYRQTTFLRIRIEEEV